MGLKQRIGAAAASGVFLAYGLGLHYYLRTNPVKEYAARRAALEQRLAQYKDDKDGPLYSHDDITRLFAMNITPEYMEAVHNLELPSGSALTDSVVSLHDYCPVEKLRFYATFCKEDGTPAFSVIDAAQAGQDRVPDSVIGQTWALFSDSAMNIPGRAIIDAYKTHLTPGRVERLLPTFDNSIADVLRWSNAVANTKMDEQSADLLAQQLSAMTVMGKPLFTNEQKALYVEREGTLEYARRFVRAAERYPDVPFSGMSVILYRQLGLEPKQVFNPRHTSRPGALVVYPAYDPDMGAFYNQVSIDRLKEIRKLYDTHIFVAEKDADLLRIRDHLKRTHAHPLDLGILSGHGDPVSMFFNDVGQEGWFSLSDVLPESPGCDLEETVEPKLFLGIASARMNQYNTTERFDVSDERLRPFFDIFGQRATIFLDSCMTATGGRDLPNFANFVKRLAGGRTVYASKKSFSASDIRIESYHPFRIRIVHKSEVAREVGGKIVKKTVEEDYTYIR
jgi:hypothetical protein